MPIHSDGNLHRECLPIARGSHIRESQSPAVTNARYRDAPEPSGVSTYSVVFTPIRVIVAMALALAMLSSGYAFRGVEGLNLEQETMKVEASTKTSLSIRGITLVLRERRFLLRGVF